MFATCKHDTNIHIKVESERKPVYVNQKSLIPEKPKSVKRFTFILFAYMTVSGEDFKFLMTD